MSAVENRQEASDIVVFELHGQRHAVEVTPLPGAPNSVLGVIDVAGEVLAVYCMAHPGEIAPRRLGLADQLLIVRTRARAIALVVDAVEGVREWDGRAADMGRLPLTAGSVRAIASLDGELLLVQDVERFLSDPEERALAAAMEGVNEPG